MAEQTDPGYRSLLQRAWPIILANASVPLLGLADTAVLGNVGTITDLGAIALGALILSFLYWSFGFLRMGTTGFIAQAAGAGDEPEVRAALARAVSLALLLGVVIIILQVPIGALAFRLLGGSESTEAMAALYLQIRLWGAPATLVTFAFMGALIGLGNSRQVLLLQLFLNGTNILLDIWFAGMLGLGAPGIAAGTLIAEWSSCLLAATILVRELRRRRAAAGDGEPLWPLARLMDRGKLLTTLVANRDIMLRTLILIWTFSWFTNQSARYGDTVLAANHLLLQLIAFAAFFLDGFAFVAEAVVGRAKGAGDLRLFDLAVWRTSVLALITAVLLTLLLWLLGDILLGLLTDIEAVRLQAGDLIMLAACYVLLSFPAFQLDGVFIGTTAAAQMRNAAVIAALIYLLAWALLAPAYGVRGLWYAFNIYVVARAGALLLFYPSLRRRIAAQETM